MLIGNSLFSDITVIISEITNFQFIMFNKVSNLFENEGNEEQINITPLQHIIWPLQYPKLSPITCRYVTIVSGSQRCIVTAEIKHEPIDTHDFGHPIGSTVLLDGLPSLKHQIGIVVNIKDVNGYQVVRLMDESIHKLKTESIQRLRFPCSTGKRCILFVDGLGHDAKPYFGTPVNDYLIFPGARNNGSPSFFLDICNLEFPNNKKFVNSKHRIMLSWMMNEGVGISKLAIDFFLESKNCGKLTWWKIASLRRRIHRNFMNPVRSAREMVSLEVFDSNAGLIPFILGEKGDDDIKTLNGFKCQRWSHGHYHLSLLGSFLRYSIEYHWSIIGKLKALEEDATPKNVAYSEVKKVLMTGIDETTMSFISDSIFGATSLETNGVLTAANVVIDRMLSAM